MRRTLALLVGMLVFFVLFCLPTGLMVVGLNILYAAGRPDDGSIIDENALTMLMLALVLSSVLMVVGILSSVAAYARIMNRVRTS